MIDEVRELLIDELKDAYSAEKQALSGMRRMVRAANDGRLKEGIQLHIEQTQDQIEKVQEALAALGSKPGRKVCEAMRGIQEEAQHGLGEHEEKGAIRDLVIVASLQRVEHYEISAYGTNIALAKAIGAVDVVSILSDILEQEKQTDLDLTNVCEQYVIPAALSEKSDSVSQKHKSKV